MLYAILNSFSQYNNFDKSESASNDPQIDEQLIVSGKGCKCTLHTCRRGVRLCPVIEKISLKSAPLRVNNEC